MARALIGVVLSGACSAADDVIREGARKADDVIREAARKADDLARGTRLGDEIARTLASLDEPAAIRVASRVDNVTDQFRVPTEVREAFRALIWDVGCDIATGSVEPTTEGVANWLAYRAASFGLEFTDGGNQVVADALLSAFGLGLERSDAVEACSRLPSSGL
ncbi:MAG: hypothetical protein H0W30_17555 [Gemmatimonadaceae bacterium]|nr:hypothetical protein [Gemmatimonadaceae bacterium]MBA3560393.1 hypothetical protein [Gemmatimonadaceae bacterium]